MPRILLQITKKNMLTKYIKNGKTIYDVYNNKC